MSKNRKKITHDQLCQKAAAFLRRSGCGVVIEERDGSCGGGEQPDCIGFRQNCSILIECKVSRKDYFYDSKKPWRQEGKGMGNLRYYLTPPNLISIDELPPGWGLLELHGRSILVITRWPANTEWLKVAQFRADKDAERALMYGSFRKAQLKIRSMRAKIKNLGKS